MRELRPGNHAVVVGACRDVPSPGLLVFPDLVQANIGRMVEMAGSPERLRPHLKTAKMPAVLRLFLAAGIRKFKCATLAEMQMAVVAGARDVLLAYQPVGPNIGALAALAKAYPGTQLGAVVECDDIAGELSAQSVAAGVSLFVFVDIDCGMHRTGIPAGDAALALAQRLKSLPALEFQGWHVYDGHLRQTDPGQRRDALSASFESLWAMVEGADPKATVIAGGTPTFPIHATDERVTCSPGTCVFWDAGYATMFPDMDFDYAALLLTRVVAKGGGRLTLDLGHKAVAAENPIDHRVILPALPDAKFTAQSEEHLVLQTGRADEWRAGDATLGIPWHICPTVALYDRATTLVADRVVGTWVIPARRRH